MHLIFVYVFGQELSPALSSGTFSRDTLVYTHIRSLYVVDILGRSHFLYFGPRLLLLVTNLWVYASFLDFVRSFVLLWHDTVRSFDMIVLVFQFNVFVSTGGDEAVSFFCLETFDDSGFGSISQETVQFPLF